MRLNSKCFNNTEHFVICRLYAPRSDIYCFMSLFVYLVCDTFFLHSEDVVLHDANREERRKVLQLDLEQDVSLI